MPPARTEKETALAYSFRKSQRQAGWKAAKLDEITGVRNPDDFMSGMGNPAVLPYVPELMLAMYNLPITSCVEDQYMSDIYNSPKDKEAFYKTISHYKLPRLSWADRIKVPVVGALSKLGLSKDFLSEGHKMCATSDVIAMLLGRELMLDTDKKFSSFKALALKTLQQMATNGFPSAQIALATYFRERGIEQGNEEKIKTSRVWATKATKNAYTTRNEKSFIKEKKLLKPLALTLLKKLQSTRFNRARLRAEWRKQKAAYKGPQVSTRAKTIDKQKTPEL